MEAKVSLIISRDRVGALIGHEGRVKGQIERALSVNLKIDSESGCVEVTPSEGCSDPATIFRAKDIVTAIGRGFSPDKAMTLLDEDTVLDVLDLRELFGRSESDIRRIKGRVIGQEGKTRRTIEEMTEARISVYGHTIATLGDYDAVSMAKEAVEMLIKGRTHATVYRFLRARRREAKKKKTLELWVKPPR